jgi:hypothetical protein
VLKFDPNTLEFKGVFIDDSAGGVGHLNRPEGFVFGPGPNRKLYITTFRGKIHQTRILFGFTMEMDNLSQPKRSCFISPANHVPLRRRCCSDRPESSMSRLAGVVRRLAKFADTMSSPRRLIYL